MRLSLEEEKKRQRRKALMILSVKYLIFREGEEVDVDALLSQKGVLKPRSTDANETRKKSRN